MFEPLKITAYLQTGVATDATLPLDGILFHYAMRERYGEQDVTLSGTPPSVDAVTLPLLKINADSPQWYYAASYAQWNGTVTEWIDHWNKRFDQGYSDIIDFGKKYGRVIIEEGRYKAYHMPIAIRHAVSVSWYVNGDKFALNHLLSFVSHIGKKTSHGDGAVLRWEITSSDDDYSVYGAEGQLMRCIPADRGLYVGYRPSYWMRENQTLCLVP